MHKAPATSQLNESAVSRSILGARLCPTGQAFTTNAACFLSVIVLQGTCERRTNERTSILQCSSRCLRRRRMVSENYPVHDRRFWSTSRVYERCNYRCIVADGPTFCIIPSDNASHEARIVAHSPEGTHAHLLWLGAAVEQRSESGTWNESTDAWRRLVNRLNGMFPTDPLNQIGRTLDGLAFFGLSVRWILQTIENLPLTDECLEYQFKTKPQPIRGTPRIACTLDKVNEALTLPERQTFTSMGARERYPSLPRPKCGAQPRGFNRPCTRR